MKITKKNLQKIIKEEIVQVLKEQMEAIVAQMCANTKEGAGMRMAFSFNAKPDGNPRQKFAASIVAAAKKECPDRWNEQGNQDLSKPPPSAPHQEPQRRPPASLVRPAAAGSGN